MHRPEDDEKIIIGHYRGWGGGRVIKMGLSAVTSAASSICDVGNEHLGADFPMLRSDVLGACPARGARRTLVISPGSSDDDSCLRSAQHRPRPDGASATAHSVVLDGLCPYN